ncbi:MAG: hypothetical protein ACRD2J_07925 [Thermoanaerobaculia bacterium]
MKRWFLAATAVAAIALAASPLFEESSESTWEAAAGGMQASVTLLTDGTSARAEWNAGSGAPLVLVATQGKTWIRQPGGDVELSSQSPAEAQVAAALLARVSGATYTDDAEGVKAVVAKSGGRTWTLTRTSLRRKPVHASMFTVTPKKGAAARLAALAGGLGGPADRSVSATAGGRGVERGAEFADGGDYEALALLETLDDVWDDETAELTRFQEEAKVGSAGDAR